MLLCYNSFSAGEAVQDRVRLFDSMCDGITSGAGKADMQRLCRNGTSASVVMNRDARWPEAGKESEKQVFDT